MSSSSCSLFSFPYDPLKVSNFTLYPDTREFLPFTIALSTPTPETKEIISQLGKDAIKQIQLNLSTAHPESCSPPSSMLIRIQDNDLATATLSVYRRINVQVAFPKHLSDTMSCLKGEFKQKSCEKNGKLIKDTIIPDESKNQKWGLPQNPADNNSTVNSVIRCSPLLKFKMARFLKGIQNYSYFEVSFYYNKHSVMKCTSGKIQLISRFYQERNRTTTIPRGLTSAQLSISQKQSPSRKGRPKKRQRVDEPMRLKTNKAQTEIEISTNTLKNRKFDKKAPQNFCPERVAIAERQGTSEDKNFEVNQTQSKTDSSTCLYIEPVNNPMSPHEAKGDTTEEEDEEHNSPPASSLTPVPVSHLELFKKCLDETSDPTLLREIINRVNEAYIKARVEEEIQKRNNTKYQK